MEFRFARPDEIPQFIRLIRHSFIGRSTEFWDEHLREPPHGGGADTLFAAYMNDRPVAALQIHPLRQWIAGRAWPMAGIGTVTVSPAHRQQRLARELMQRALHAAVERGDVVSALYPFRASFYQKLGYGLAGDVLQYMVPPAALPQSDERLRCELLDSPDARAEALALYHDWIRTQTGQVERTPVSFERQYPDAEGGLIGYRDQAGRLQGYAVVGYRADLPADQRFLDVAEIIWTTPAARSGLYGWLATLGDQWQRIMLRGLRSHRLQEMLSDVVLPLGSAPIWGLWRVAGYQMLGPMFRLLDVRAAWNERRVQAVEPMKVTLDVRDALLADNSGSWTLELEGERARLERGAKGNWQISLDVSTLSRLFIGALRPSEAREAGLLICDRPEKLAALDDAFRLPEPWMFDRF